MMLGMIEGRRRMGREYVWMASPTQWTWVWASSVSWWWTGEPGVLQSMGSQRVGHEWATELNWTQQLPWPSLGSKGQFKQLLYQGREEMQEQGRSSQETIVQPWGKDVIPQEINITVSLSSYIKFSSVQFSRSVVSHSLRPHELQHARPPCPSPTAGLHSDSRPSSQWCHPAISSSVIPFCSCLQSLPASECFPMNQLFTWGGQSTGVSALASFLPKKSQDWSPSEWTGWIFLQYKGLSRVFSNTTVQKHQFFSAQPFSQSDSHIHTWPLEKP